MLRALRLVSVQRGYDLREFTLIAYGGAGPVHAGALARQAGIVRIVVPAHSGAFSALGCLVSPLRYDTVQTHRMRLDAWDRKVVADRLRALESQCLAPLLAEGHPVERVLLKRSADLRYTGQNYELEVDGSRRLARGAPGGLRAAPPPALRLRDGRERRVREPESLGATRERRAACSRRRSPTARRARSGRFARTSRTPARSRCRATSAARCRRVSAVAGPAIVEDEWSTTIVYPGQRCQADRLGNLVIEVGA